MCRLNVSATFADEIALEVVEKNRGVVMAPRESAVDEQLDAPLQLETADTPQLL
jgi:hypothetical protein